jgi:hypothetical protein
MVAGLLALWTVVPVAPPAQAPDSAGRARVMQALQIVQDSLDRVRGAAYNFRTDLGGASGVVLYARTQRMYASCVAAERAVGHLDSVLTASYPGKTPPGPGLRREARALRAALAECRREYDTTGVWPQRADSVRAWAPYRLHRLDEAARRYTGATAPYRKPPSRPRP